MKSKLVRARDTLRHVLFVCHQRDQYDGSRLYRCVYQAKQLANAGVSSDAVYYENVDDAMLDRADVVIMSRCQWGRGLLEAIDRARARDALVCGDLDDYIFEPWEVHQYSFLRGRGAAHRDLRKEATFAARWRDVLRLLLCFDVVLVSTPGLKDALEDLGIPAHVSRNAFDTDVCAPIARERTRLNKLLVMSGTRTHDGDLRLIAGPLAQFLCENPTIECTFLGPIELPGILLGLPNITRRARLPLADLYPFVAEHDLCLFPLEDTTFNNCKSAIKFIECGIVSVPLVASPRREFRELVRDGQTGFLVDQPESWYRTLCMLRDEPERLSQTAKAAHAAVLAEHTVMSRGSSLADYLASQHQLHVTRLSVKDKVTP